MSRSEILRQRSLLALLAAEVVSTTGSQMTWLALPWFVLVTSGSATRMSFVMAAELLGLALLGLPGGRVLGRLGAQRTMIVCDSMRAPLMLAIRNTSGAGMPAAAYSSSSRCSANPEKPSVPATIVTPPSYIAFTIFPNAANESRYR